MARELQTSHALHSRQQMVHDGMLETLLQDERLRPREHKIQLAEVPLVNRPDSGKNRAIALVVKHMHPSLRSGQPFRQIPRKQHIVIRAIIQNRLREISLSIWIGLFLQQNLQIEKKAGQKTSQRVSHRHDTDGAETQVLPIPTAIESSFAESDGVVLQVP